MTLLSNFKILGIVILKISLKDSLIFSMLRLVTSFVLNLGYINTYINNKIKIIPTGRVNVSGKALNRKIIKKGILRRISKKEIFHNTSRIFLP
ncbi:MAG: hypothetical protein NTU76_00165 [Candidatus Taylorbacteria bacterium]|nr:hypothetical protein [Candidatus Taylorbacteria bacterium]